MPERVVDSEADGVDRAVAIHGLDTGRVRRAEIVAAEPAGRAVRLWIRLAGVVGVEADGVVVPTIGLDFIVDALPRGLVVPLDIEPFLQACVSGAAAGDFPFRHRPAHLPGGVKDKSDVAQDGLGSWANRVLFRAETNLFRFTLSASGLPRMRRRDMAGFLSFFELEGEKASGVPGCIPSPLRRLGKCWNSSGNTCFHKSWSKGGNAPSSRQEGRSYLEWWKTLQASARRAGRLPLTPGTVRSTAPCNRAASPHRRRRRASFGRSR